MSLPRSIRQAGWWLMAWAAVMCPAAVPNPAPSPAPAKYLFFVEASAVTAPISERVALAVADLIERGCGGRMQAGDWFSILPFHEQVDPVGYTRKTWEPARSRLISNLAFLYVQKYKFEKKPRFDLALALLQQAVREERNLHIYLVVSGLHPVLGTPFDADINAVLRQHVESWRQSRGVCVIALVAERGQLVDWAVGVSEPPAPARLVARRPEPPPPPAVSLPPPPPSVVQTSPAPARATNAQTAPAKPPKPLPQPPTNLVAQTPPPVAPTPQPPPSLSPPKPTTPEKPPESKPQTLPPATPTITPIQSVVQTPQKTLEPPPKPAPTPVISAPSPPPPAVGTNPGAVAVISPPDRPAGMQTQAPAAAPPVETALPASAATSPIHSAWPATSAPSPAPTNHDTAGPAAGPVPPAPTVAVMPPPTRTPYELLAAGAGLLGLAVWLARVWIRRTRPAAAPSLITQSMERQRRRSPGQEK